MLIWKGAGILVPLAGVFVAGTNYAFDLPGGLSATLAAGLGLWYLGRALNDIPDRRPVDPETGQSVPARPRNAHHFFFVPMHWWGMAAAVLGGGLLLLMAVGFILPLFYS